MVHRLLTWMPRAETFPSTCAWLLGLHTTRDMGSRNRREGQYKNAISKYLDAKPTHHSCGDSEGRGGTRSVHLNIQLLHTIHTGLRRQKTCPTSHRTSCNELKVRMSIFYDTTVPANEQKLCRYHVEFAKVLHVYDSVS